MKARIKALLFAAGVAAVLVTVASAGGSASAGGVHGLNIRNGVIHACYETQGDAQTRGDLKLYSTSKGCKPVSWNLRGPKGATGPSGPGANGPSGPAGPAGANGANGAAGPAGAAGSKGDKGDKGDPGMPGTNPVAQWGGYTITGRDDSGCTTEGGQEVWAHDNETRFFVVTADQRGNGYFVTRYDLNGTYTAITDMHDPGSSGCDSEPFGQNPPSGPFNGVWTVRVRSTGVDSIDYNPDAQPATSSWPDFLGAVFHVEADPGQGNTSNVTTTSYEFDYYNACNNEHYRDTFYSGEFVSSGHITDCSN